MIKYLKKVVGEKQYGAYNNSFSKSEQLATKKKQTIVSDRPSKETEKLKKARQ